MSQPTNQLAYTIATGTSQITPPVFKSTSPTQFDVHYPQGQMWINEVTQTVYSLVSFTTATGQLLANWVPLGSGGGGILTLSAEGGVPSLPVANNFDFAGAAAGAITFANPGAGFMEASVNVDGVTVQIIGNQLVATGGSSIPFTTIVAPQLATANTGWFIGAALTLTLPASGGLIDGDQVIAICRNAGPIIIQANAAQTVQISSVTSAVAGTATNTATGDAVTFRFEVASTSWIAESSVGNWTVV